MKRRMLLGASLVFPLRVTAAQSVSWDEIVDVVVVGGGAGGLTAALSCALKGMQVLLLEKMPHLGGDSIRSGGYFNAVTREAVKNGKDSTDLFISQILESSGGFSDEAVVRVFAEKSGESLEWLQSRGVNFLPAPRYIYGGLWQRAYKPVLRSGTGYIQALSNGCLKEGVEIRTEAKVTALISDKGSVVGVRAECAGRTSEIRAVKGVVLASGGFGANKELLSQANELYSRLGTDSHPGATGEIIRMASSLGARIVNMNFVECVPGGSDAVRDQVRLDYHPGQVIFVDQDGNRFVEETSPRAQIFEAYRKHQISRCYTVADSSAVDHVDVERRKNIYRGLYSGLTWRCDTLEELARKLRVDPVNLKTSVKTLEGRGLSLKAPYWAVSVVFRVHTTLGGVAIDSGARVLGNDGKPIPGLYACGQIVGNLHGKNRLGGNGLNCAVTFGRLAAESIAKDGT